MQALQVTAPHSFSLVQAPVPDLRAVAFPGILVRPLWVSLCGSDIPKFAGMKRYLAYPLPAGAPIHECLGEVVESTSDQFRPGDRVIALPEADRGLAEFFIAQEAKAVRLPPELGSEGEGTLIQPLCTVLNGVDRLPPVAGRTVAVMGLGSIGLLFCWAFREAGAARIVGIDPNEERCRVAKWLGVAETWTMRGIEVVHASRRRPSTWEAPDMIVEAVGHQTETINDCFELVKNRGTVMAFGVPDQNVYPIEYETFFRKNAQLIAAVTPVWSAYLAKARDVYLQHRAELKSLFTHRLSILEAERAFALYEQHGDGIIKCLMDATCWQQEGR